MDSDDFNPLVPVWHFHTSLLSCIILPLLQSVVPITKGHPCNARLLFYITIPPLSCLILYCTSWSISHLTPASPLFLYKSSLSNGPSIRHSASALKNNIISELLFGRNAALPHKLHTTHVWVIQKNNQHPLSNTKTSDIQHVFVTALSWISTPRQTCPFLNLALLTEQREPVSMFTIYKSIVAFITTWDSNHSAALHTAPPPTVLPRKWHQIFLNRSICWERMPLGPFQDEPIFSESCKGW